MFERQELFIGGGWSTPSSDARLEVHSPHDFAPVGSVPAASPADVDAAVAAATSAPARAWGETSPAERADAIRRISTGMQERYEELAALITAEMGSPISFSLFGQALAAASVMEAYADVAATFPFEEQRAGIISPVVVQKVPVGVAAGIVAWNVPIFLASMKLGAALAAGAPIILKPSPEAPLSSFLWADIIAGAGLPDGVVSILPGDAELGRYLVAHPGIDKVSFTGSTAAGRSVGAVCGELLKRCTLELGGKSAAIVMDDADLATVVPQVVDAGVQNNGQVCAAQTRILVGRDRHDEVVDALGEHLASLVIGDPADPATQIGPLVTERQRERVEAYMAEGRSTARLVTGGGRPDGLEGHYVEPTLFAGVDNDSRIAREEIFGPVLTVIAYDDVDHAVELANDSDYGLSGSVWGADAEQAAAVAGRVRTGVCAVNSGIVTEPRSPFGGFRNSGIGREMGPEGVAAYLETRTVVLPPG